MQAPTESLLPTLDGLVALPRSLPEQDTPDQAAQAHQLAATLALCASVILGLLGNFLFYDNYPGINLFLFIMAFLGAGITLVIAVGRPIARKNAIFAVPAAIFALLLGVRAAPQLILFNAAAMIGSLAVVIICVSQPRFLGGHWLAFVRTAFLKAISSWIESWLVILPESAAWFKRLELDNHRLTHLKSAARGVLLALPVVIVFAVLLSSADMVFGDLAARTIGFFLPNSPESLMAQAMLVMFFTVTSLAGLRIMLFSENGEDTLPAETAPSHWLPRLNIIEASIVLGSVNVLFGAFVTIQTRYLFGGQVNINLRGYTYAEYARRGFYELLAVSFMTMLLIITLDAATQRKRVQEGIFRVLVGGMIGLTFVILIAAFRRLDLYENAYGYTRIRVMSGVFMFWLALLIGALLAAIFRRQRVIFGSACIVTALGFGLTLNLMNMDAFIASRNIARFERTDKLDVYYLLSLSDDAIPTIAPLLDNDKLDTYERAQLLRGLGARLSDLDRDRAERGSFGYHVGKSRAWKALDAYRPTLRPYLFDNSRW
jgi:hypothetical protein